MALLGVFSITLAVIGTVLASMSLGVMLVYINTVKYSLTENIFFSENVTNINRTILAPGTPNQVLINDAQGDMSSEAQLDTAKGGTAQDSSGWTGVAAVSGGTWSARQIVNGDVSASAAIAYSKLNLALSIVNGDISNSAGISRSKLAAGTANYVLVNDGAGAMSQIQLLDAQRGGTGQNSQGWTGIAAVSAGTWSARTIVNGDVSTSAAIARSKLAAGTANYVLVNDGAGVMSEIQLLDAQRGGTGQNSQAWTGIAAVSAGTWSARTIVNADVSNTAAIDRSKLAAGSANYVLVNDGAGAMSEAIHLLPELGGTGQDSSAQSGIPHVVTGDWTWSCIVGGDVCAGANISRATLTPGTPNTAIIDNGQGVLTSVPYLNTTLGGTGVDSSASSGVAHLSSGAWTFSSVTNSDMASGTLLDNSINAAAAITRSKLAAGTPNTVVVNDGSGVMSSQAQLASSLGGTGADSTSWAGVAKVNMGTWSASCVATNDFCPGTNGTGNSVYSGPPNQVIISSANGTLTSTLYLQPVMGGTGLNTSASTGIAQVANGVWSVSDTLIRPITIAVTSNQITFGVIGTTVLNVVNSTTPVTVTLPATGLNSNIVLTEGSATVNGQKTFSSPIGITASSNQLVFGPGPTTTFHIPTPASSRIITFPDVFADSNAILSQGNQTMNDFKTFTNAPTVTAFATGNSGVVKASGTTGVLSSSLITNADVQVGAQIDGSKIVAATCSVPGVVTINAQCFAGDKSFSGRIATNGATLQSTTTDIELSSVLSSRKISLYSVGNNINQYAGIGYDNISASVQMRFQVDASNRDFVYYSGVNSTLSTELFRVKGTGVLNVAAFTTAGLVHNLATGDLTSSLLVAGDVSAGAINSTAILDGTIVNADISPTAAIAYSKLNLANSITNTDISPTAAIQYSKLALTNSIVNADINSAAAIAWTKLASGSANNVLITNGAGVITSEALLDQSKGGTHLDTSASNGIAQVTAGTWSVSSTVAPATTFSTSVTTPEVFTDQIQGITLNSNLLIATNGNGAVRFQSNTEVQAPSSFYTDFINGYTANLITIGGTIVPSGTAGYDVGSTSLKWRNGYFSGTVTGASFTVSGLSPSQAVVTDGSSNLASLPYTQGPTGSTLVFRDSNGFASLASLLTTAGTSGGGTVHWALNSGFNLPGRISIGLTGVETGSNAGSDLFISASNDTSSSLGTWLKLVRANGQLNLYSSLASTTTSTGALVLQSGGLGVSGAGNFGGTLTAPSLVTDTITGKTVSTTVNFGATILPNLFATYDIGSTSFRWRNGYMQLLQLVGGELQTANVEGANQWFLYITDVSAAHQRWSISLINAETGSNAGSDLTIWPYDDTGTGLSYAMQITRSNANVNFRGQLTVQGATSTFSGGTASSGTGSGTIVISGSGGLGVGGNINAGGSITVPTTNTDTIAGKTTPAQVNFAAAILPTVDATDDVGSASFRWRNAFFSGTVKGATFTVTGLTPSQAVVTDASSNLASLQYTPSSVSSTIMSRDANAGTSVAFINTVQTTTAAGLGHHFFQSNGSTAWAVGLKNVEIGGQAGSDLFFWNYNDTGSQIGAVLSITRSTGQVSVLATIVSTTTGTGALIVPNGGVGIAGAINVGGASTFTSSTASTTTGTGAVVVTGGVGIGGQLNVGGATNTFSGGTASTTTGTGAIVISGSGGLGVGGAINVGGASTFTSSTASTTTGTGAVVVTGGVGIGGQINVGGATNTFSGATASTSSSTGTIVISGSGGLGVGGAANLGGKLGVAGGVPDSTTQDIQLSGTASNRKLVFFSQANNVHQFLGFGFQTGEFRFQVNGAGADFVYYAGTATPSSVEIARIQTTAPSMRISGTSNQFWAVGAHNTILNLAIAAADRTYTFPDATTSTANVVLDQGPYTIAGTWTFSAATTTFSAATASTTTGTGAVVVTGGVGIGGQLNVGGATNSFTAATASTTTSTGAVVVTGGVGIGGQLNVGGATNSFTAATASTTTGTGAVVVTGGVGIGGQLNVGGATNSFTAATASTTTGTGAIVVTGGVGIGGQLNVGGATSKFTGGTASSSTITGTVVVTGGVGISGSLNAGGDSTFSLRIATSGSTFQSTTQDIEASNTMSSRKIALWSVGNNVHQFSGFGYNNITTNAEAVNPQLRFQVDSQATDFTFNSAFNNSVSYEIARIFGAVGSGMALWNSGGFGPIIQPSPGDTGQHIVRVPASASAITVFILANTGAAQTISDAVTFNVGTASTSTSTGAIIVSGSGGIGVGGQINVGGATSTFSGGTASTTTSTGTIVVSGTGGIGVGGAINVAGASTFTSSTASTSSSTGALVITGGLGVGGKLFTGGAIGVNGASVDSTTLDVQLPNTIGTRKLVLYSSGNNAHQVYSLGIQSAEFRLQADSTADFGFYVAKPGSTTTADTRIFRAISGSVAGGTGIQVEATTNQVVLGGGGDPAAQGKTTTINAPAPANNRIYSTYDTANDCNVQLGIMETITVTGTTSLTIAQSGSFVTLNGGTTANFNVTLPAATAGVNFLFTWITSTATKSIGIISAAGKTFGYIIGATTQVLCTGKTMVLFTASVGVGDGGRYWSDGTNWYVDIKSQNSGVLTCT